MMLLAGSFLVVASGFCGNVSGAEKVIRNSELHEREQIEQAMKVVIHHFKFNFKGCTLLELVYDDEFQKGALHWAKSYGAEKAMVLQSSFQTDHRGSDGGLNPNDTYTHWKWILVWEEGQWRLKTWGYG